MIYIASPYSANKREITQARYKIIEACTAFWMSQGLPVFSPIVHCHNIAEMYELPTDFTYWQRINKAWIASAKALWVLELPNWKLSVGVANEIEYAESMNKDVSYFQWTEIVGILSRLPKYAIHIGDDLKLLQYDN